MTAADHFLDLALRGRDPLASDGEQRAHRLAMAVVDNTPGLDGQAIDGLKMFIDLAVAQPETARELLGVQ